MICFSDCPAYPDYIQVFKDTDVHAYPLPPIPTPDVGQKIPPTLTYEDISKYSNHCTPECQLNPLRLQNKTICFIVVTSVLATITLLAILAATLGILQAGKAVVHSQ